MEGAAHLTVIQHTSAEYLGLMEDHLEGRRIRFTYHRPFTERGGIPRSRDVNEGLILLGGGPWGSAGPANLPTLVREVELAADCLARGVAVVGIGLGAQILALAGGGKTYARPLRFEVGHADRLVADALNAYLPESFVHACYMRDDFEAPADARVLARREDGGVALFQLGHNALGFSGHPGFKAAIAEDLIMEFADAPPEPAASLRALRTLTGALESDLIPLMTGLIQITGWMA